MASYPKVSIITSSFNQAPFLEQAIQSVLEQDYPNIEYIIVDGGSTDGSADLIRKYAARLAYWVSEPDGGQYDAQNKGLRRMTGEIWAWMNADDAYLPGAIKKAAEWLSLHPAYDIVYGDCMAVDENGENERPLRAEDFDFSRMLTGGGFVPTGSTFFRRTVMDRIGEFDESLHYVGDLDYLFRAGETCVFEHVSEAWSLYRIHSGARTWDPKQSAKRAAEIVRVYEKFWDQAGIPVHIRHLRRRSLASVYLYAAYLAAQINQRNLCFHYVRKGMEMDSSALRPRLVRLFVYLLFGKKAGSFLRGIRPARFGE